MIGRQDSITSEIYKRLKHIIDDVYLKRGISASEVRHFFIKRKNLRKIFEQMKDLKHIYDSGKHEEPFENFVHDILFYRILADRIYYEKDNPKNETFLLNYDKFVNEARQLKRQPMVMKKDLIEDITRDPSEISTRDLRGLVVKFEHQAKNVDDKTAKQYLQLAQTYREILEQREKKLHDDFMKHVDSEGRWIHYTASKGRIFSC